ncbi:hypothetical protein [Streptomyces sp. VRA16 Mangrove soil]|uniref:hypothetical protein n=1 Tax=Streptomyces sp. VRA16 Mangrove soil TaxID=2817434 RepID=UPI001A9CECD7|nr:hypothetical protein [Streptomyces sp. VRA16 Mangrove soil]MBO1336931.1 hypothetical protein [Streptomyces sp. VRA16 Mangrove soil]
MTERAGRFPADRCRPDAAASFPVRTGPPRTTRRTTRTGRYVIGDVRGHGLDVVTAAAATGQRPLALLAAVLLGAGYGLSLSYGLTRTAALAPPARLARWTAGFWTAAYLGMFTPYVITLPAGAFPTVRVLTAAALLAARRRSPHRI